MDHCSKYCYAYIMRRNSSEETLWAKEAYDHLEATHRSRVCAWRLDNRRFIDPQFNEEVQTCGQHISYFRVGSNHQNTIVELRIN